MTKKLIRWIPIPFIIVVLAWLAVAVWTTFFYKVNVPQPTISTEPWRRLVVGCEYFHVFESDCARDLHASHYAESTVFKYEDCVRGKIHRAYPARCWPFYDQPPYIEFDK